MHAPAAVQHRWLCSVIRGHYAYYGLPSNLQRLASFQREVQCHWFRVLRRRSQRAMTYAHFNKLLESFPLPSPRITHPRDVLAACRVRESRKPGSVGAKAEWLSYPTIASGSFVAS